MKAHGLKLFVFFYFLSVCVLMCTCRLAVMSCFNSLITLLQLLKMSVMNESVQVAIPFKFYHNTQPKNFKCLHKVHFSKSFLGKLLVFLPICIMKKSIWKFSVNRIVSVTGLHV